MDSTDSPILFSSLTIPSELENDTSLFMKYKEGKALPSAPFKLFELQPTCSSTDEEFSAGQGKNRVRGPYRKYTCKEKEEAVQCVSLL